MASKAHSANEADRKPRRWGRRLRRAGTIVAIFGCAAGAWVFHLAKSEPAAWRDHQRFVETTSPEKIASMAGAVEGRLMQMVGLFAPQTADAGAGTPADDSPAARESAFAAALTAMTPEQLATPRTIKLTREEMNAVLQTHLREWSESRGYDMPDAITNPMIWIEGDHLVFGFRFEAGAFSQVITGTSDLKFEDDGKARFEVLQYRAGQLPIPVDSLGDFLRKRSEGNDSAAQASQWIEKLRNFRFKPVFKLKTRHTVHATGYRVVDNGESVELTVTMMPPKKY